ncbi:amidohydrolase [Lentilactobacillus buchneri]|uniref:amidohydrolase family protein n=1 Tax=Lentilactobacillus buchneri TaxID=1581 RepID=UPI0021A5AB57|nr:amidohydrolase family protein [Lentilactobacillus buchneri]MCT3557317.1 amidohydrolase [Lentilactobacillus buchneri]MCT3563255.1 amidohydrolase [Lentilactobacillus buchneri]
MKKIDGHLHLVRSVAGFNGKGRMTPLGKGRTIWDDGTVIKLIPDGWGDDDFTAESALKVMKEAGIDKAVLLQGSLNGYQNYYSYQSIKKYPEKFIGAFSVDPFSEFYMKIVKRHVEDLGFRAMKFEISQGGGMHGYHYTTPFRLDTDPRIGRIFHFLSDYPGFTVTVDYGDFSQFSYQPEAIANLAKMYPRLDFVVCHLSFPNADHLDRLQNALEQWAPYKNIYTDISAIQDIEGETEFPFPRCQKDVSLAKNILGAGRIIWGTDSPWSSTFNSYKNLSSWLEKSQIFSDSELENVMYNNAMKVYFKDSAIKAVKEADDPAMKD